MMSASIWPKHPNGTTLVLPFQYLGHSANPVGKIGSHDGRFHQRLESFGTRLKVLGCSRLEYAQVSQAKDNRSGCRPDFRGCPRNPFLRAGTDSFAVKRQTQRSTDYRASAFQVDSTRAFVHLPTYGKPIFVWFTKPWVTAPLAWSQRRPYS